jgi:hypothetical protein
MIEGHSFIRDIRRSDAMRACVFRARRNRVGFSTFRRFSTAEFLRNAIARVLV